MHGIRMMLPAGQGPGVVEMTAGKHGEAKKERKKRDRTGEPYRPTNRFARDWGVHVSKK